MNHLSIRLETENDHRAVENLTREAFWNVYKPACDEHYYAHMLRSHPDFLPELDFVAECDGELIGSIMYCKTALVSEDGERKEILTFGPLSVLPAYQRRGCGKKLIEHSFERARELGYDTVVIFGSPANYVARGFVSCKKAGVCVGDGIFPTAMLVKELVPDALRGKKWQFIDSSAAECCTDTAAVEAFDALFPPKEGAWTPTQEEFYIYSHSNIVF